MPIKKRTPVLIAAILAALAPLAQAEPQTASAPAIPAPRLVTLFIQDAPIQDAFDLLSDQVHIRFSIPGNDHLKHISIDARQKPLWETVHQLAAQIGHSQPASWDMADPADDTLHHFSGRICTNGPYLIIAEGITHEANYLRPDNDVERILLNVRLIPDPSLQLLYAAAESRPTLATDDRGQSLLPIHPLSDAVVPVNGDSIRFAPAVQIVMERPASSIPQGTTDLGRTLKLVQGEIAATSPTFESVEVPVAGTSNRIYESITARFICSAPHTTTTSGGNSITVHAEFARPIAMLESDWGHWQKQLSATRISVLDAKGKPWLFPAPTVTLTAASCTLDFEFVQHGANSPGDAAKVIVNVPIKSETLRIPYRFENLPLP